MLATSLSRSSRSPRKSRISMTAMAESGVRPRVSAARRETHGRGQAVGQGFGEIGREKLALEPWKKNRIGHLVELQQIVGAANHVGELGPASLGGAAPAERRSGQVASDAAATRKARGVQAARRDQRCSSGRVRNGG